MFSWMRNLCSKKEPIEVPLDAIDRNNNADEAMYEQMESGEDQVSRNFTNKTQRQNISTTNDQKGISRSSGDQKAVSRSSVDQKTASHSSVEDLKQCLAILERRKCKIYAGNAGLVVGFTATTLAIYTPLAYYGSYADQFDENCHVYNTTSFNNHTNFSTSCGSIAPLPESLDFWHPYKAIATLEGVRAECETVNATSCVSAVDKILSGPGISTPWSPIVVNYAPPILVPIMGVYIVYKKYVSRQENAELTLIENTAKKYGMHIQNVTLSTKIEMFKQKLAELSPSERTPLQTNGLRRNSLLRCCRREQVNDQKNSELRASRK